MNADDRSVPLSGGESLGRLADREENLLAPYATRSVDSAGRKHAEPEHPYRSPYQRDRDRIVHSSAFRRLAHKTQVFTGDMGDYHRSRLTHTLEVASIARTLARALRLNEDLVEALALAHDIGHPPFGHAGEQTLDECAAEVGGFNHNRQALRILELLETRYPNFPGLNLTHEVLAGQAHRAVGKQNANAPSPSLEVQLVDAADSIAYDAHDADDALQLGLLEPQDLNEVELWREVAGQVTHRYGSLSDAQFRRAVVRKLIDHLASDLLSATRRRLADAGIETRDQVFAAGILVRPTTQAAERQRHLESFLFARVYRHPQVLRERDVAQSILREMFTRYRSDPTRMPLEFQDRAERDEVTRTVVDYLAGMTDRFAWEEHARLTAV